MPANHSFVIYGFLWIYYTRFFPLRVTVFLKVIIVEILRLRRYPSPLRMTRCAFCSGSNLLPSTLILNSLSLGVSRIKTTIYIYTVAEAFCFHSREALHEKTSQLQSPWEAVEFCKSAFTMLGFFGTLCTRPATKSKISARASNGYNLRRLSQGKWNHPNITPPTPDKNQKFSQFTLNNYHYIVS